MSRKTREQTQVITIPSGTPAGGIQAAKITLDTSFERAEGVNIVEIAAGGLAYYRLSIQDSVGNVHTDMAHKKTYEFDPERAYKEVDIPIVDRQILVRIDLPEATTAALVFDISFKLTNRG
ncbi:MAG: hypothetical protein AAGI07_00235 [Bacteroidota bacterium]